MRTRLRRLTRGGLRFPTLGSGRPIFGSGVVAFDSETFPPPSDYFVAKKYNCPAIRSSARRAHRRHHADKWASSCVDALNELDAGTTPVENRSSTATAAHMASLDRIASAVRACGPKPSDLDGEGALRELLAKQGYSGEPSALAPLDADLLSLPLEGWVPKDLLEILGDGDGNKVVERLQQKVLPKVEAARQLEESPVRRPFMDPNLRGQRRRYVQVLSRLERCGLLEWRRRREPTVGLFAVWKKSGRQRLIIDARLANLRFAAPDPVSLATGASLGSILEVDAGERVWLGQVDVADAFYTTLLPEFLCHLFALPEVQARDMELNTIVDGPVGANEWITPVLRAVPMGWSLALGVCQEMHEVLAERVPHVLKENLLVDRRVAPSVSSLPHTEYVHNFTAMSVTEEPVKEAAELLDMEMARTQLPTHGVEVSLGGAALGWEFAADTPSMAANPRRCWRLKLAIDELRARGYATGRELSSVIGQATFVALIRRGSSAIFGSVYRFMSEQWEVRAPLWPSVDRELRWFAAHLPLLRRDLSAPWSSQVDVADASMWGMGMVTGHRPASEVASVARVNERWRFSREE